MAEYRVHDPDKGIIGPISLETVQDLVDAGVVHDGTWVSRDAGPFLPIAAFSEISPQPAEHSRADLQPTYSGDLGKNTFFKVFYRFHVTRATGLLAVHQESRRKEIYLAQGQPSFVKSNLPNERLGEYLIAHKKLDRTELDVALGSMHTDDNRLGYTLIRLGIMEPTELFEALRTQQTSRLVDLCTWERGRYLFYDGLHFEGDAVDLKLAVPDLVVMAARDLPSDRLESRLAPHFGLAAQRTTNQLVTPNALRLTAFERRVANAIDGKRTVGEIINNLEGDQRRAAMMVLYLLWEIDAIVFTPPG
ncbi:DUF4388 domain-containing protein [Myxococcota bacterium]